MLERNGFVSMYTPGGCEIPQLSCTLYSIALELTGPRDSLSISVEQQSLVFAILPCDISDISAHAQPVSIKP